MLINVVRQLKNITEQISIIETNRDITAEILRNYLPEQRVNSGLPALFGVKASAGKAFESEREILYQVLFDMRRDVTELKKLVNTLMSERGAQPVPPSATTAVSYYQEPQRNLVATVVPATPTIISAAKSVHPVVDDIQDTEEFVEEATLSLDEVEKQLKVVGVLMVLAGMVTACSISYKFNGSSIDYTKVKTISFENFPNRSAGFVWGPMESMFNTALQDIYMQQTRLKQAKRGGDLQLSGEITNYDALNKGIGSDGYSSMVELRMTVRVNFVNNSNPTENMNGQQFSASREYNANQQLSAVQDELVTQMIKEIVEQIFNATVANW